MDESQPTTGGGVTQLTESELGSIFDELAEALKEVGAYTKLAAESRIGFFEKLTVLNAGTLALVVSIVGTLSQRLADLHIGARHAGGLVAACWFFVAAILASVVHNLFQSAFGLHGAHLTLGNIAQVKFTRVRRLFAAKGTTMEPLDTKGFEMEKSRTGMAMTEKIARRLAPVAILCTATGYVLLMFFLQGNISALLPAGR